MYEYQTEMRIGEKAPAYAQITVPGSSASFTSTSANFQLLNKDHTPVTSPVNFATAVTASLTSDLSKVYYVIPDTLTVSLTVTDYYLGLFTQYGSPDSIPRIKKSIVQIYMIY